VALTAYDGAYERRDGRWYYAGADIPVPGATDRTPADILTLFYSGLVTVTDGYAAVPRDLPQLEPDFAWVLEFEHEDAGPTILVPQAAWEHHLRQVTGLWAPELQADRLLGTNDVSALSGKASGTISAYRSRGTMPGPLLTIGHCPVWSRPTIQRWIKQLRGREEGRRQPSTAPAPISRRPVEPVVFPRQRRRWWRPWKL
jgi:hypothetical protein